MTGEFPAQRASYAENASIWWRHHVEDELDHICFVSVWNPRQRLSIPASIDKIGSMELPSGQLGDHDIRRNISPVKDVCNQTVAMNATHKMKHLRIDKPKTQRILTTITIILIFPMQCGLTEGHRNYLQVVTQRITSWMVSLIRLVFKTPSKGGWGINTT